jgi:hypothetical protein
MYGYRFLASDLFLLLGLSVLFVPAKHSMALSEPSTSIFGKLAETSIDPVEFRAFIAQTELRLADLAVCANTTDCADETDISVMVLRDKPKHWPDQFGWPSGGAIVISYDFVRRRGDGSLATEEGCKAQLNLLKSGFGNEKTSPVRFMLTTEERLSRQMVDDLETVAFVKVSETFVKTNTQGMTQSMTSVVCGSNPSGRHSKVGNDPIVFSAFVSP